MPVNLIRRPEVEARTGLSRSTLYDWMKRGDFPLPLKLGTRIVAWRESDVADWLDSRATRANGLRNKAKAMFDHADALEAEGGAE